MSRRVESLIRVLRRGGMLVAGKGGYLVYRSRDARRAIAGVLPVGEFEKMRATGELVAISEQAGRWIWGHTGEEAVIAQLPITDVTTLVRAIAKPERRSILEAVLMQATEPHQREWLARAAARFLRDYEHQSATQSVTMSWDFDRGSFSGKRRGASGMSEMSLSAQKTLGLIRENLGTGNFELVERVLIARHSKRRLCCDFAWTQDELITRLAKTLERLARLYDMRIAAPT